MITVGSSILVFFNILKLLPVLFFLEFEILLSIVHPILFVDFLEHAAIRVLVSCDVKVYLSFLFSLRHWWNNIFETLFVLLIDWHVWIYLQLFGSLEIVFTGATLLTQIVLLLATCGSNDGSVFFARSLSCTIICFSKVNKWALCFIFTLLWNRSFILERFFTLLVAGNTIFHINELCRIFLCLSRWVIFLILIFSLSNLMHVIGSFHFSSSIIILVLERRLEPDINRLDGFRFSDELWRFQVASRSTCFQPSSFSYRSRLVFFHGFH